MPLLLCIGVWLCMSVYILYMGYKYGSFFIWHYDNGDTTTSAAVDDKTMVTMSSTVVVDPVVVSQL